MTDIDQIQINFSPEAFELLNFVLAFLTFGVALDIRFADFRRIFENPKKVVVGLTSQWILLPLFTIGLIYFVQPPPSVALGLALVAACPGGNVSNYASHLAKANAALSVTLTSLVTLFSLLTTPLIFGAVSQVYPAAAELLQTIELKPSSILKTIVILIIIPLAIGLFIGNQKEDWANRIRKPVQRLSMLIFMALVIGAVISNVENILEHLHHVFFLVIFHNCIAYVIGYYFAKANRLPEIDRKTIAIETGIQNSGLGLVLIFSFFQGLGGMMIVAAWWGVWDLISVFLLALWWNRQYSETSKV